jgi:quinol monooxygenase YgiN
MTLTIVAKVTATEGNADALAQHLTNLVAPTRAEVGCIQYDLHRDTQNDHVFLFFELWSTRELWQDHMSAPHITALSDVTDGLIASSELNEMAQIA